MKQNKIELTRGKINLFFENYENIIEKNNKIQVSEFLKKIQLEPKTELAKLEETLSHIKKKNEGVTVENFKEIYNMILRTNADIR